MNIESVQTLLTTVLAFITVMTFLYLTFRSRDLRTKVSIQYKSDIESIRKSLEDQIYDLTNKLIMVEERWKDVNHLLISAQKNATQQVSDSKYISPFLKSHGLDEKDIALSKRTAFVLVPFNRNYEGVFESIKEICNEHSIQCLRGDEDLIKGDIFRHILKMISKSGLVIAVIDGRNPNVFYELGLAHGIGKSTILISKNSDKIPFDVKSKFIVLYRNKEDLKLQLSAELQKYLNDSSAAGRSDIPSATD